MLFEPLKIITAIKIVKEIGTIGSSPLLVIDQHGNAYYAKTTSLNLPKTELINELFCACALQCWEILVPQVCLIKIPYQLVEQHNAENPTPISKRYKKEYFDEVLFFGSLNIGNVIELQDYLPGITRPQFKQFYHPQDLIKIGVFDLWIGNRDRKPENPNFLISSAPGKIGFYAIDHTAAFAHITDYKEVKDIMLQMERKYCILATSLAKNILEYLPKKVVRNLNNEILDGMATFNKSFDEIGKIIPSEWGFSKKAKAYLKTFFNDTERNNRISNSFLNF